MFSVMLPLRATLRFALDLVGDACECSEPSVDCEVGREFIEEAGGGRFAVGVVSFEPEILDILASASGVERWPLLGVLGRFESGDVELMVP